MVQKRKTHRFHLVGEVAGNFANNEKFLLKDISKEGLQLVSNFSPLKNSQYTLLLTHKGEVRRFEFEVTHVETGEYQSNPDGVMPVGVLYNVGGRLLHMDDGKREFIMSILYDQ